MAAAAGGLRAAAPTTQTSQLCAGEETEDQRACYTCPGHTAERAAWGYGGRAQWQVQGSRLGGAEPSPVWTEHMLPQAPPARRTLDADLALEPNAPPAPELGVLFSQPHTETTEHESRKGNTQRTGHRVLPGVPPPHFLHQQLSAHQPDTVTSFCRTQKDIFPALP